MWIKNIMLPLNRLWKPKGPWDFNAPTFSRKSVYIRRWGCLPYAPAEFYRAWKFLAFISGRGSVDPRGHSAPGRVRSIEYSEDHIEKSKLWPSVLQRSNFRRLTFLRLIILISINVTTSNYYLVFMLPLLFAMFFHLFLLLSFSPYLHIHLFLSLQSLYCLFSL